MNKKAIMAHGAEAVDHLFEGGISLHDALKHTEDRAFEEALDPLRDARWQFHHAGVKYDDLVETARLEFGDDAGRLPDEPRTAERRVDSLFEHLRRRSRIEGLFYDDPTSWNQLRTSVVSNDPFGGYDLMYSFVLRLRDAVDGVIAAITRGDPGDRVQDAVWRTLYRYFRVLTLGNTLSYVNRETRGESTNEQKTHGENP